MAATDWPVSFPPPVLASYREQPQSQMIRTEMDAGPAKVRRRFTAKVTRLPLEWHLTSAQVSTLDSYYDNDLKGGSLPITAFTHPRTGVALNHVRFVEPYEVSASDKRGFLKVTGTLEVLPE